MRYQVKESEFLGRGRLDDLLVPGFDDGGVMLAVVDDPQRQLLDALLRVVELRELPLQGGLRVAHGLVRKVTQSRTTRSSNETVARQL